MPGGYRFVDYGPECAAFLRGIAGEPAILVGHSLGAMTAIWTAAHHPDLVSAIVLAELPERGAGDLARGADGEAAGRPVEELVAGGISLTTPSTSRQAPFAVECDHVVPHEERSVRAERRTAARSRAAYYTGCAIRESAVATTRSHGGIGHRASTASEAGIPCADQSLRSSAPS